MTANTVRLLGEVTHCVLVMCCVAAMKVVAVTYSDTYFEKMNRELPQLSRWKEFIRGGFGSRKYLCPRSGILDLPFF